MRIGYDGSAIGPRPSGVGHYAASLLDALLTQFPSSQFLFLSHRARHESAGANLVLTQKRSFAVKELWMQAWLPHILARHNPDLCHFTNSVVPLCFRRPYVVTVHDLSLIRHPEWHPRWRRLWMGNILRPSVVRASRIICDAESTRRDILEWAPVDPARVQVIPLAARASFFGARSEGEKAAIREKYALFRPFILYVGNIEPRKNLSRLLEAFGRLNPPGIDLVLVGRRAWDWREALGESGNRGARGKVRTLGYVSEQDLSALYQSARAFVYPSLMEGFGLPVLEAMASGTPVLASNVEPLASLVGDAGRLVRPDCTREWQLALVEAIEDRRMCAVLGARGRARAEQYSWDRVARETMSCYEAALSQPIPQ